MNDCVRQWIGDRKKLPLELEFLLKIKGIEMERMVFEHVHIHHQSFHVKSVPHGEYVFLYLEPNAKQDMSQLHHIQMPIRISSFAQIIGSSDKLTKAVKRGKAYAKTDKHVWISGESGTGKATFAEAIYSASLRNQSRFYSVSCQMLNEEKLKLELLGTETKLGLLQVPSKDTLYLKDIDKLSPSFQELLATELRKGTSVRVICSSTVSFHKLLEDEHVLHELLHLLGECQLEIPPLRHRTEDIEEIARVFIAKHNVIYGKQVVGMREEVVSQLKNYRWPGNVSELQNRMGELLVLAKGHYIGSEEWDLVWEGYSKEEEYVTENIDLNGTWEQIEKQILKEVLKKEGMNQSRTAKRLGISRATLWRKLQ